MVSGVSRGFGFLVGKESPGNRVGFWDLVRVLSVRGTDGTSLVWWVCWGGVVGGSWYGV